MQVQAIFQIEKQDINNRNKSLGAILVDNYKKVVELSGLKDVKIISKGKSACIEPDTKDPVDRAILDSLGDDESLEGYAVGL